MTRVSLVSSWYSTGVIEDSCWNGPSSAIHRYLWRYWEEIVLRLTLPEMACFDFPDLTLRKFCIPPNSWISQKERNPSSLSVYYIMELVTGLQYAEVRVRLSTAGIIIPISHLDAVYEKLHESTLLGDSEAAESVRGSVRRNVRHSGNFSSNRDHVDIDVSI